MDHRLIERELGKELYGDACLYLGMMASVDPRYTDTAMACVDSSGKLWRNPEEAELGKSKYEHGTSRDMLAGFLLACVSAKDVSKFKLFCSYVKKHKRLGAGDLRTQIRPGNWSDIGLVLKKHRLGVLEHLGWWGFLCYLALAWFKPIEDLLSLLTPKAFMSDYQVHLVMVSMMFRAHLGKDKGLLWRLTVRTLDYCMPHNAVVKYLKKDYKWLSSEVPHMFNRAMFNAYDPITWPWAKSDFVLARMHMNEFSAKFAESLKVDLVLRNKL